MAELIFGHTPTHPGEVIKEEIEYRGISQRELAKRIGMPHSVVNEILNGKRIVSTRTAYLMEAALGIPAYSLLRLQLKYDIQTAQADASLQEEIATVRRMAFTGVVA